MNATLRYFLIFLAFTSFGSMVMGQNAGIFQTYIILDVNGTGNQFLAGGINSDGAPTFSGQSIGTVTSLILNGGEIKTFKNSGGDVTGAELNYRIQLQGGGAGSFTAMNLPFAQNFPVPGDQQWQQSAAGVDLLNGLAPGTYELEVFWKASTNIGDQFDSNFGANHISTFTIAAPAAVPTLSEWGLIILAILMLTGGTLALRYRATNSRAHAA